MVIPKKVVSGQQRRKPEDAGRGIKGQEKRSRFIALVCAKKNVRLIRLQRPLQRKQTCARKMTLTSVTTRTRYKIVDGWRRSPMVDAGRKTNTKKRR